MNALQKIFPNTVPLSNFLEQVVPSSVQLIQDKDPPTYRKLLEEVYVLKDGLLLEKQRNHQQQNGSYPIREVINRIIAQMVRSASGNIKDQNCLCLGYRSKAVSSEAMMKRHHDIECCYVNTVQPMLQTQAWQILLNRIGL
jgi:hypothetical protein